MGSIRFVRNISKCLDLYGRQAISYAIVHKESQNS